MDFLHQTNPHRFVNCFKNHLVEKGYNQQYGIDFEKSFSWVVKPVTISLALSIVITHSWSIKQLDISIPFPQHVCCLHKSFYGLKQTPHAWSLTSPGTSSNRLVGSKGDVSLFMKNDSSYVLFLLIYIDLHGHLLWRLIMSLTFFPHPLSWSISALWIFPCGRNFSRNWWLTISWCSSLNVGALQYLVTIRPGIS